MNNFQGINSIELRVLLGFKKDDNIKSSKNNQYVYCKNGHTTALGYLCGFNVHKLRKNRYRVTVKRIIKGKFLVVIEKEGGRFHE